MSESFAWVWTSMFVSVRFFFVIFGEDLDKFGGKKVLSHFWQGLLGVLFWFDLRLKEGDWNSEVLMSKQVFLHKLGWLNWGSPKITDSLESSSIETFFFVFVWFISILMWSFLGSFFRVFLCCEFSTLISISEKLSFFGQEYFLLQKIWINTIKNVQPNLKQQHLCSSKKLRWVL